MIHNGKYIFSYENETFEKELKQWFDISIIKSFNFLKHFWTSNVLMEHDREKIIESKSISKDKIKLILFLINEYITSEWIFLFPNYFFFENDVKYQLWKRKIL
jgi:hypothetical protein